MFTAVGSIGDIIAIAQVAGKLYKALRASQGSAAEFQDVVLELSTFYGTLERVNKKHPSPTRPDLTSHIAIIGPIVHECKAEIEGFLDKIVLQYGRRLGAGAIASKRGFKEMGRMLQWSVFKGAEVGRLREKLMEANAMIQLVYSQAQGAAAEEDAKIISDKLKALSELEAVANENLNKHIVEIQERIEGQNRVLESHTTILKEVSSDVQSVMTAVTPMAEATFDMKSMLIEVQKTLYSHQGVPRSLDPWLQRALYLEDSLGYVLPIPLETISSWETLHAVLCDKFISRPGYELVKRRQYIFQDGANGRDLSVKVHFTSAVRPGQKITMCMAFFSPKGQKNVCPKCGTVTIAGSNTDVNCSNTACQMIYRRVVDGTETSPFNNQNGNWSRLFPEEKKNDISLEENEITDCVPSHLLRHGEIDDSPDVFKRVRLFTRWQDAEESRAGDLFMKLGDVSLWEVSGPASEVCNQMSYLVQDALEDEYDFWDEGYESWDEEGKRLSPDERCLYYCIFFLGTCRRKARPVLIVYSKYKSFRNKMVGSLRGLDWLDPSKSGVIATTWYNPAIRRAIIEERIRSCGWDRGFAEEAY
ncbi:hypothetical protein G7Y89_g6414 [Cudoniella acicularis]|uniref:Ubiquitin-like domain-containing protein n=1 Tax=Cudoniella acicularis TaxID=354080 RepID=A0A8H4RNW4_9HELO|nr:hypothetical protein G7Y89_g6414 [Cudoniella acicularis]